MSGNKQRPTLILLAILAITLTSYWSVLSFDFINWDDPSHLTENPLVRSLEFKNINTIFQSTTHRTYNPLTLLSFALEYHFFQYNPFVYHLDNLVLHLAVTALVFFFCLKLGLDLTVAGLAALLFGIHPIHVESVAWITARKDVLYALFYLSALISYLQYIQDTEDT